MKISKGTVGQKGKCRFSDTLNVKFLCFIEVRNMNGARCGVCDCIVNISFKGASDLGRQMHFYI